MPETIGQAPVILCACGCGGPVKLRKYPSQGQPRFINTHQHKGENNGNFRGGKVDRVCPVCLSKFKAWPSQNDTTCSNPCFRKWLSLTGSARGVNKVDVVCDYCGKPSKRFPSQVKEKNYCNRSCLSKTKTHENNGNWRGGQWKYIQKEVLIRDENRCLVCGFDLVVDVHHITSRRQGGTDAPENLVTLCPNHHRMTHAGIISIECFRGRSIPGLDAETIGCSRRK